MTEWIKNGWRGELINEIRNEWGFSDIEVCICHEYTSSN